jgi:hypothetical protein
MRFLLPLILPAAVVLATVVCGPGLVGGREPPSPKEDLKTLAGGVWRRPADKGPDWVRLEFKDPEKSEILFVVSVYSEEKGGKLLQQFGSGAVLQEEKTKRFIFYGDDENRITYRLKDNKLILEGKYTNGSAPRQVIDLSGEWVKVDRSRKEEKR